ncbi:MAG: hypothetical protein Q7U05_11165 [Polaromonas sp.]|nr:hypothetical protein [Polaromonas sp.]
MAIHWCPFMQARAIVRSKHFKTRGEFLAWCRTDQRPSDIPTNPQREYAAQGWVSYLDWLGLEKRRSRASSYPDYDTAHAWVLAQGWNDKSEFDAVVKAQKLPSFVPKAPHVVYKECGWVDWIGWLGSGKRRLGDWREFGNARQWAQDWAPTHGITSSEQWVAACQAGRIPADIPRRPDRVYAEIGWKSWGDWLVTSRLRRRNQPWRSFAEARAFVHALSLGSWEEWRGFSRSADRPHDIPAAPYRAYQLDGWAGFDDWVGLPTRRKYGRSRQEQHIVMELQQLLGGGVEDEKRRFAADGPLLRVDYLHEGMELVVEYDGSHWHRNRVLEDKRKSNIIRSAGWRLIRIREQPLALLHKGNVAVRQACTPGDAVRAVLKLMMQQGLGSAKMRLRCRTYLTRSDHLTTSPLPPVPRWRPFDEARAFSRALGFQSSEQWRKWATSDQRPPDIPNSPGVLYAGHGWAGMADWLGYHPVISRGNKLLPFKQARAVVRSWARQQGEISNKRRHWVEAAEQGSIPEGVPANPQLAYKGKGWRGMPDWYGRPASPRNLPFPCDTKYLPFEQARKVVRRWVKSLPASPTLWTQWLRAVRDGSLPPGVPRHAGLVYRSQGWRGYEDWFGRQPGGSARN